MIIVTCHKCGKEIHKADKCPYCGNSTKFGTVNGMTDIHENAYVEYSELATILDAGDFAKLIEKSRAVLRWMPTCSGVFWMRLLAKNGCKTDAELIQKGINCDDSADFYNAYRYGTSVEKATYDNVKNLIENVRAILESAIITHEYEEKSATPIMRCKSEFPLELQAKRKELFELWTQLEKTEQEMHVIEQECKLLLNEHKIALDNSKSEAVQIKTQSYKLNECTSEEFNEYMIRLGNVLNQSDTSKKEIELMRKQLPWIETFNNKVQEREEINLKITSKLSDLRSYENRIKSTVSEIEHIEKRHRLALRNLANYDFQSTISLLGIMEYEESLSNAGLTSFSRDVKETQSLFEN